MLQDQLRRKTKRPPNGADASLETADLSSQVPDIDNVLDEVGKALQGAENILDQIRRNGDNCTCW